MIYLRPSSDWSAKRLSGVEIKNSTGYFILDDNMEILKLKINRIKYLFTIISSMTILSKLWSTIKEVRIVSNHTDLWITEEGWSHCPSEEIQDRCTKWCARMSRLKIFMPGSCYPLIQKKSKASYNARESIVQVVLLLYK